MGWIRDIRDRKLDDEKVYLDAYAVMDCFSSWYDKRGDLHGPEEMIEFQRIEALPAADVREIRRGRWVQTMKAHMEGTVSYAPRWGCSCCGAEFLQDPSNLHFLFCPECGADMREEDDAAN